MNKKRSRFWLVIIWSLGIVGALASVTYSLVIPSFKTEGARVCELTRDSLRFGYLKPSPPVFAEFVDDQNTLKIGTRMESTKACIYLKQTRPLFYSAVDESPDGEKNWPIDILRRIGVAIAGLVATFLISLTFIFKYQTILTLEEIRDINKSM